MQFSSNPVFLCHIICLSFCILIQDGLICMDHRSIGTHTGSSRASNLYEIQPYALPQLSPVHVHINTPNTCTSVLYIC